MAASNAVTAMEAPDDVNSDHDIDTEHESSLSEVICPNGRHKWKHDQCLVCTVCGECTGIVIILVSRNLSKNNLAETEIIFFCNLQFFGEIKR